MKATHSIHRRLWVALSLATLLPAMAMAEFTLDPGGSRPRP